MTELDQKLINIKIKITEKDRLSDIIKRAEHQKLDLEKKKSELYKILQKEEQDVEKLKKVSFSNFLHQIIGDKADLILQEKQDVITAKLKYDEASSEVDNLDREIDALKDRISAFGDLQSKYERLLKEKEQIISSRGGETSKELQEIVENIADLKRTEKEIMEAIEVGKEALASLKNAEKSLYSSSKWANYDALGGGIFLTALKHSRLDSAQQEINKTQFLLKKFHRELQEVGGVEDLQIDVGSFLIFADYFFDGLFVDLTIENRINKAKIQVEGTMSRVKKITLKLEDNLKKTKTKFEALEKRRRAILENTH